MKDLINKIHQPVPFSLLGELGKFYSGLSGKNRQDFKNGNCFFATYKNVYNNPSLSLEDKDLEKVKINESEKQTKLELGDVIFTCSSEIYDESVFSSVVTKPLDKDIYLNSFCFLYRLNNKNLYNFDFLKHLLRSNLMRKQLLKTVHGVIRFNVSRKKMALVKIPLPNIEIQNHIVNILDSFSSLSENINQGLPYMINLYEKLYHYYQELLLNFQEKKEK